MWIYLLLDYFSILGKTNDNIEEFEIFGSWLYNKIIIKIILWDIPNKYN